MNVVAVMPAWNEASRIKDAIFGVKTHVDRVVVVDDGSHDGTAEAARDAGAVVVCHAVNRGQGAALKTGNVAALKLGADIVVHVDADGQHDPESLPRLLEPIKQGNADVVFGSRFLGVKSDGMPAARRALLFAARVFSGYALGLPRKLTDPQSGYRAMTADAVRAIDFRQDGYAHCSEILRLVTRSNQRWMEVPARIRYSAEVMAKGQKPTQAFAIIWQLLLGAFQR